MKKVIFGMCMIAAISLASCNKNAEQVEPGAPGSSISVNKEAGNGKCYDPDIKDKNTSSCVTGDGDCKDTIIKPKPKIQWTTRITKL